LRHRLDVTPDSSATCAGRLRHEGPQRRAGPRADRVVAAHDGFVTLARSPWSEVRDLRPWPALVRAAFHAAYLGIGEAYQGADDVEDKVAAMSRYPADLLACTASAGDDLVGLLVGTVDGTRLVIYDLFVAPALRRRGVGRQLVEAAISETRATLVGAEVTLPSV